MTVAELKAEAEKLGYAVTKKPCYQCTCYMPYPNENHKNKNGTWKCIDKYEPIKYERKWRHSPITRCKKKGDRDETRKGESDI